LSFSHTSSTLVERPPFLPPIHWQTRTYDSFVLLCSIMKSCWMENNTIVAEIFLLEIIFLPTKAFPDIRMPHNGEL